MKLYETGVASNGVTFKLNSLEIGQFIQKLKGGTQEQHVDRINFSFNKNGK
jgi:hypothetical protein